MIPQLNLLGVRLARYSINWFDNPGDPTYWNSELAAYAANGIDVLATVAYRYRKGTDFGAFSDPGPYAHCSPSVAEGCIPLAGTQAWTNYLAEWTTFATAVINANASSVRYWSPWNEPNEPTFFNGSEAQYDALAQAFCTAVRNKRAQGYPVYCVGPEYGIHNASYATQLDSLAPRVAADSFDVLAIHVYNSVDSLQLITDFAKSRIPLPVWITETGVPDPSFRPGAVDVELQERDVVQKAQYMKQLKPPGSTPVDALFFYDLQTGEAGLMSGDSTGTDPLGATVHFDPWRPRPAFHALKRVLAGTYSQPGPGYCSGPNGLVPCDYKTGAVFRTSHEHWDCVMHVYVRERYLLGSFIRYRPAVGASVLAYRGAGQYGQKLTDSNGNVKFNANCNVENGLFLVHNGTFNNGTPESYSGIGWTGTEDRSFTFTAWR